jgi:hypothetical protein
VSADTIVNAAQFAWKVIENGAASADIEHKTASAVPKVDDWMSLAGTRGPNSWRLSYKNRFMWPLDDYLHVDVQILLKWQFGARYKGGGAFIPNIWIEVPECFVGWPWDVNIGIIVQNPTNAADPGEPPLAAIPVTVKGTVSSGAELDHVEWGFVLYGNGASTQG